MFTHTLIVPTEKFSKFILFLRIVCKKYYQNGKGVPFQIQWQDQQPYKFGSGNPEFTIIIKDDRAISMIASLDGTSFLETYILGNVDIQGNIEKLFSFREMTTDKHLFGYIWNLVKPLVFGQVKVDRSGISSHYDLAQGFYLSFLDNKYRCYSQAIFLDESESLENAINRKLKFAINAIDAKPGDNILDIGGGWGAFNEYAGKKGINVTSITISEESEKYLNRLIKKEHLPCKAINCHLYEFHPKEKFDAIVNLGVTEHLPDYKHCLKVYQQLLKPGGKLYLDASATRKKYNFHKFIYKYIYPGNCSPLCLHDFLFKLSKTPFRLLGIWDDRYSYYLTAKHWVENLERNHKTALKFENEAIYRMFQVYLWGTVDVFKRDIMQAYRILLELPAFSKQY